MEELIEQEESFYTDKAKVFEWLQQNKSEKEIDKFAAEYKGERKIRKTQIGYREDYIQKDGSVVLAEKILINMQRKIVRTNVSFLMGNPPTITANEPEDEEVISVLDILKKNRFPNKLKKFAETVKSETIAAIIFTKAGEGEQETIKFRNYSNAQGEFTPHYDPYGDLIGFFWEFTDGDSEMLWIFDNENIHIYENQIFLKSVAHGFGIIPVVFLEQENPEWWEVKEMIDRLEQLVSKLSASNNYFAFPILKLKGAAFKNAKGEMEPLIKPGEDGKSIMLGFAEKNGQVIESDAEFLQRDTGIESIDAEVDLLTKFIFSISQTPDLSFDNVKGIGAISGVALELMFMDAINKARWDGGEYDTVIQRCISVIRHGLANGAELNEEIEFEVEFNLSLPRDIKEEVMTLVEATGGQPILSRESAISLSPLTKNANEEIIKVDEQIAKDKGDTLNFEQNTNLLNNE